MRNHYPNRLIENVSSYHLKSYHATYNFNRENTMTRIFNDTIKIEWQWVGLPHYDIPEIGFVFFL